MQSDNEILSVIIRRFPENQICIYELFEESETFKELCRQYYECSTMLNNSSGMCNKNIAICKEYEILMAEIEYEISERILG